MIADKIKREEKKSPEEKLITNIILGFFYKEKRYETSKIKTWKKIKPVRKEELNFLKSKAFKMYCGCREEENFEEKIKEKIKEKFKKDSIQAKKTIKQ